MQKEIGSNFDLNPQMLDAAAGNTEGLVFPFKGSDSALLSTGRGAESLVLDEIEYRNPKIRKTALIPPFTCQTVIEPFIRKGYEIKTYSIERNLELDLEKFRKELCNSCAQVLLIHQYFGFSTGHGIERVIEETAEAGMVSIEDRTQCLYSGFPALPTDYVIGSLRKWAALPDGGFAICRSGRFHSRPDVADCKLEAKKLEASQLKYDYLHKDLGEKEVFLKKFEEAEKILDEEKQYYKISRSSLTIQSNLDVSEMRRRRRANYTQLYMGLQGLRWVRVVTPKLRENDVPLYCAVAVQNRNELQERLRENNIYAPIVWPKSDLCPQICVEAQELYDSLLCLPIDQRYDADDMDRVSKCVKGFSSACGWSSV